jgi:hygromycin-B 7''-O-kinase
MQPELPSIADADSFERCFNDEVWAAAAAAICARHAVACHSLRRSPQGENIIFFADESFVVKIFGPHRDNYAREKAALEFARGKLDIETPELLYVGDLDGWPYLLMRQLAGEASREIWASVPERDRYNIVSHLGAAMSQLHSHRAPLQESALNRDWHGFIEQQARASVERQRACGANPEWLDSLPSYINSRLTLLPAAGRPQAFLHGDIHAGNLLLAQKGGRWRVAGLIDFGDSLCGFQEYEFVAPGVLMVQGSRELQRALLLAYGYGEAELDLTLRARLMLLTVLYECSDLRKYALRLRPDAIHLTLEELEAAIWPFADS